jgi:hypothetical protein
MVSGASVVSSSSGILSFGDSDMVEIQVWSGEAGNEAARPKS